MTYTYPPEEVEALLQEGDLEGALAKGWFGDEWCYRLVQTAGGGSLRQMKLSFAAGEELGLDLCNDAGVAAVRAFTPHGAVGQHGTINVGDVIRVVNGQTLFTCEAVVQAIKRARGAPLRLVAVRPPPNVRVWHEDHLAVAAGKVSTIAFETTVPMCLTYSWQVQAHDVLLHLVRLGERKRLQSARRSSVQTSMFGLRATHGRGHVELPEPGDYLFGCDNTFSMFRSKDVRYTLRLVPLETWEAGRSVARLADLESECVRRKARSQELSSAIAAAEETAAVHRAKLEQAEADAAQARRDKDENLRRWRAAKEERECILSEASRAPGRPSVEAASGG